MIFTTSLNLLFAQPKIQHLYVGLRMCALKHNILANDEVDERREKNVHLS